MKAIDIKVKRTGFPFKLAGHEFFFDCSAENIEKYYSSWEQAQIELQDFVDSKDSIEIEDSIMALNKAYGLILAEGEFQKLYDELPDIIAWEQAFIRLSEGIYENVQEFVKQQEKESKKNKKEYLLKQAKKKG